MRLYFTDEKRNLKQLCWSADKNPESWYYSDYEYLVEELDQPGVLTSSADAGGLRVIFYTDKQLKMWYYDFAKQAFSVKTILQE